MSVSNLFDETTFFSPAIPALPQLRESPQANDFDGRNVILQDSHESLVRASVFFKCLARNLSPQEGSKSPLQALLERSFHIPASEENELLFSEVPHAFFKQKGYLLRLFSNESWEEWFDHRTALGKVASQLRNCIEGRAEVCSFTKEMNPQLIQKANEETSVLLKGLGSREVTKTSKGSCLYGLTSGIAASFLLENPLPMLMGLSECFPRAYAQQKVGNEFQVNTYTTNSQRYPSVASLADGNFVVVWASWFLDGSDNGVFGQLFDGRGTKIGSEFQANTYIIFDQGYPSVASFSNGNFVVTWMSDGQDGDSWGVYGQVFDGNGSKIGSEFRANSYTIWWQRFPSVASFSNGNFVVTWMSYGQDGSADEIYGQLFDGNGSKIGSEFRVNSYTTNDQRSSSVASFSNGNFVVTWWSKDQDGSGLGVYGQLFNGNGSNIGSEFQVNSYTTSSQHYPSVASFSNGNFVVTWASNGQDGSDNGVYGQLFTGNASNIGSEFQVNTYSNNSQSVPVVAGFSDGNFVVTWQSSGQDGSASGVYGQLFNGNGSKIGSEFRANTYVTFDQMIPSVASLANGNFVVTWQSDVQDGSGVGIYGQIFNGFSVSSTTRTTTSFTTSSVSSSTTVPSTSTTSSSSTSSVSSSTTVPSTSTTSSMTSSVSSRTTVPSTSTTSSMTSSVSSRTTVLSTIRPVTTSNSRTTLSATSDPSNLFSWIWFLLGGVGAFSCLGLTGYFIFKSRDRKKDGDVHAFEFGEEEQTGARSSEEIGVSTIAFELKPVVQRHKVIGEAYFQLSTLVREEAEEIYLQTGLLIPFPEAQKKFPYEIGNGHFGKIKVAQRIENKQYVTSEKVKGEENIRASNIEAQMRKAASGDNVLPIYNTIQLEDALYHFMPLAGLGDGSTIQQRLALLHQSPLAHTVLHFIAQNILTGLQTIHAKGIYHLNMKPDNLVFTKDGTAYITDFGCAKGLEDTCLPGGALGDNRYFSPERLQSCREGTFDAEKADMWAAGVTLLQIFYNQDPLELLNMPQELPARVERCDQAHFDEQLQRFSEVEKGSVLWVVKGLLDTNPEKRLTAKQALQASCFHGVDKTEQESAFEDFRKETVAQLRRVESRQVNLRDYEWAIKKTPEEESSQANSAEQNQQFNTCAFTPSLYQLTPGHVTASSSSSGYQLTPGHVTASSSSSGYQLTPGHVTASSSSSGKCEMP